MYGCGNTFDYLRILDNSTGYRASGAEVIDRRGGAVFASCDVVVSGCTFWGNSVVDPMRASATTSNVPDPFNVGHGGALGVAAGATVTIDRMIGAVNGDDEAIYCEPGASISITCSNIFGNPDGDWIGCIAGQLGVNGNISVDPMFCDAAGGDFHLSSLSPCLYAECGVMGALGQGCFDAKPALYSVKDVGNDQGRQVRLTWQRSLHDSPTANPYVVGYAVYRKQGQFVTASVEDTPLSQAARGEGVAILGWDYLGTVPSRGDSVYETVVPTLCDSTITDGPCLSTFFVSAMTSNPFIYYDSPPHDGYSKDNLAPPTPTSFAIAYNTGSGNHLAWDAVAAADFAGFRVYRDGSWVANTTQTSWIDPDVDGWNVATTK